MRTRLLFAVLVLVLLPACIPSGENNSPDFNTDTNRPDGSDIPVADFAFDTTLPTGNYIYIMIVDRTPEASASGDALPGADIDGVELVKGGTSFFAEEIHDAMAGPVNVTGGAADFTRLLRAPQQLCSSTDPDFVSMGADGGVAIVTVGDDREEIAAGDELVIYECDGADDPDGATDTYDVFIGISPNVDDPNWIPCVTGASGETRCTVPTLPDPNDPNFNGSCTFSDGVCTQFNGVASRADATARCADTTNPSGEAGVLSNATCSLEDLAGACANNNPPSDTQEALYIYDSFAGDGQTYCETDLGLVWTPGEDIVPPTMDLPFKYVRIVDSGSSMASGDGTDGADIDGIMLLHAGQVTNGGTVESTDVGGGGNTSANDPGQALGVAENDCDPMSPTFYSLGDGGDLVLSLTNTRELDTGDVLTIFACGAMQNPGAPSEPYDVWLGTHADPAMGTWTRCLANQVGIQSCVVPEVGATPMGDPYSFVIIADRETSGVEAAEGTVGVDIDAIQLQQSGLLYFATSVDNYTPAGGDVSSASEPLEATGAPENSCDPMTAEFVSLGGDGGFLTVSFANSRPVQTGDVITIYECGAAQSPGAPAEIYDVFVGSSADPQAMTRIECATGETGISTCVVPALP